jgi:hypothetical protein
MQSLPQIVVERLRAEGPAAADAHPDANLLAAFAEQGLAEPERAKVTEHLIRCDDCREVVGFALPANEVAEISFARPERSDWFRWPVLRWGAVAAGLSVLTSIGIVQYKHSLVKSGTTVTSLVARTETSPAGYSNTASGPQLPDPQTEKPKRTKSPEKTVPRAQNAFVAGKPVDSSNSVFPIHGAARGGVIGGAIAGGQGIGSGSGAGWAPKPMQPAPQSSQVVQMQAEAATFATAENRTADQLVQNQKEQSVSSTNLDVVKAKKPEPEQAVSGGTSAPALAPPNVALQTAPALMLRALPRWTISSTGALQRSFDAGQTWEDVNVNPIAMASRSKTAMISAEKDAMVSANKDEGMKKQVAAQPTPGLVFRAVAAIGPEVWAGGLGAMLYHSGDSGTQWTRIAPSNGSAVLTGDVTSIQFSDAQHGVIATSSGELWITADNGQSWLRQ